MPDGGLDTGIGCETNIDSILVLGKRIKGPTVELTQFGLSRNSLPLPVARVFLQRSSASASPISISPPSPSVAPNPNSPGYRRVHATFPRLPPLTPNQGSRSGALEHWGNGLGDRKQQRLRSGTAPLNLSLDGTGRRIGSLDKSLRGTIRKVRLRGDDTHLNQH